MPPAIAGNVDIVKVASASPSRIRFMTTPLMHWRSSAPDGSKPCGRCIAAGAHPLERTPWAVAVLRTKAEASRPAKNQGNADDEHQGGQERDRRGQPEAQELGPLGQGRPGRDAQPHQPR